MGILNIFSASRSKLSDKTAECPSCHQKLAKEPRAKTKCSHCGEFMFVRTRSSDRKRVVVTKNEADKIDREWSIKGGLDTVINAVGKEDFSHEKQYLQKKFGESKVSDHDVLWSLLNKQLIKDALDEHWGMYTNTRLHMAEVLRNKMSLEESLKTYLEVYFLNLNGPMNFGKGSGLPRFDPTMGEAMHSPYVVDLIKQLVSELKMELGNVKRIFIDHNSHMKKNLKLPLSPEESWALLEKEINSSI